MFRKRLGRQKKCYTEDVFKTSSVRLHQDECLLGCTSKLDASQPARDVLGASPEGALKVLMSGTSRGPSGDP